MIAITINDAIVQYYQRALNLYNQQNPDSTLPVSKLVKAESPTKYRGLCLRCSARRCKDAVDFGLIGSPTISFAAPSEFRQSLRHPLLSALATSFGIFVFAAITAAVLPRTAKADEVVPTETSQRMSDCSYIIGFAKDSDKLTDDAKRVIAEAFEEEQRTNSGRMMITGSLALSERWKLQGDRTLAIANELLGLGAPRDQVQRGTTYDIQTTRSVGYIYICSSPSGPASIKIPSQVPGSSLLFQIGSNKFEIPLRYLDPNFWHETPAEPVVRRLLELELGWPGLLDRTTPFMRVCYNRNDDVCLHNTILVKIYAESMKQGDFNRPWPLTDYRPIQGLISGIQFFVKAQGDDDDWSPYLFLSRLKTGKTIYGECGLSRPQHGPEAPSSSEVQDLLTDRSCRIIEKDLLSGSIVNLFFVGSNIGEWQKIISTVNSLIMDFLR